MRESGFCCDTDTDDSNTMNKKVRNAQLAQYNFIFGEIFEWSFFLREKEVFQFEFFLFSRSWARRRGPTTPSTCAPGTIRYTN